MRLAALAFVCLACGSTPREEPDAGVDASMHDAGGMDASSHDAGVDGGSQRPDAMAPPPDATVISGASTCTAAPRVEAPLAMVLPETGRLQFVRVGVPPQSAVGLEDEGNQALLVCADCDSFERGESPSACVDEPIPPARLFGDRYLPTGLSLAINTTDTPDEVVLASPGERISLHRFELLETTAPSDPCVPAILRPGQAYASTPSCGVSLQLPASSIGLLFGYSGHPLIESLATTPMEIAVGTEGSPIGLVAHEIRGARCDDPIDLVPGRPEPVRVDIGGRSGSELCNIFGTMLGARYVRFQIPARSRAVLEASARMIADGGGWAILAMARRCDATAECETVAEQPWIADAPPGRLVVDNASEVSTSAIVSVHQGGVGYEANVIDLLLYNEPLP
jgi:hypothetical protein